MFIIEEHSLLTQLSEFNTPSLLHLYLNLHLHHNHTKNLTLSLTPNLTIILTEP